MHAHERSSGSESPNSQQDSPGGVKHVLWAVKDKAKKLKNKIKRRNPAHGHEGVEKALPGSDDEVESDGSPTSAEHQEPKREIADGNAGYDTRDSSGDKSEVSPVAYSPRLAVQDGPDHFSEGAKYRTGSVPSDGEFPKENLAAEKRNVAEDFKHERPRELTDPMQPTKVSVIDTPESLVASAQRPPFSTDIPEDGGVSELVNTKKNTERDEDVKVEESFKEQLSGKSDIDTASNKTADEDGIPVSCPSTIDQRDNVDGERGSYKGRACDGLANAEESVAGAAIDHKSFSQGEENSSEGGIEIENQSEGGGESPREQQSILQVARERIVGVTNYFSPGNVEDNPPADEQDIGLSTDEQSISASDKQIEPTTASTATETGQGLRESVASKLGSGGSSTPAAATGAGDGECAQEKQILGPDHEQQLTSCDNPPLSPNTPTIASRAAGTVLGLKDTLVSRFGYGITSPTSSASPTFASEEDATGNLREMESPKSKSYMQQLQEVAAGGKDSLLNKLGYGEQKTSENWGGNQQAPETVDQQKSSLPKEEEIAYGAKDTMAEVGSFPDHKSATGDSVTTDLNHGSALNRDLTTGDPVTTDSKHGSALNRDFDHGSAITDSVSTVDHQKASIFDPGEDDVALSQIITDTVSGTAASLKDTLLSPFSPKSASSPTPSDSK